MGASRRPDSGTSLKQWQRLLPVAAWNLGLPLGLWALLSSVGVQTLPMPVQIALALLVVVPLGPMVYRLAYQPLAARRCWCC